MDSLGLFTLSTINFLCGCTVLRWPLLMSSLLSSKEGQIELKSSTLLAFGGSLEDCQVNISLKFLKIFL